MMKWPEPERWQRLWRSLNASGDPATWHEILTRAYAEPHRHYHNQRHIAECLTEFDTVNHLAKQPHAVELALWFHDAIYDPKATDNEEQSAALAKRCLEGAGRPDAARIVTELVMVTKLHSPSDNPDSKLVLDIDLSILGQNETRFTEYESAIRAEYAWVPKEIFNTKRAEILQGFLNRKRIYLTEDFASKYERQARRNLENSICNLRVYAG